MAPRRLPGWLPRALAESALIVFGVLLALVLNEWREEVSRRERTALAMAAVRAELEQNRALVAEARAYHERLAASFAASAERGDALPDQRLATEGLLSPGRVLRTAWESAQQGELLAEVPYPTVLALSRAYARQAEYEELTRAGMQIAYERLILEGFDAFLRQYPHLVMMQREFANREALLREEYDRALAALE